MLRFPYQFVGSSQSWRPLVPVRILGPQGAFRDFGRAILDTGSDDTLFGANTAALIGAVLEPPGLAVRWHGQLYPVRFAMVELKLTDYATHWRWPARVGFTPAPLRYPILGQRGALQYFNAEFLGELRT